MDNWQINMIGEFKDRKAMIEKLLREANASREMYKNAGGEKKGLADAMYDVLVVHYKHLSSTTKLV